MTPAIPFLSIVKQYAEARGLPFFYWDQMQIAIRLYCDHAKLNN
jgi:hypothetical protein